jgi:hypothetical protein
VLVIVFLLANIVGALGWKNVLSLVVPEKWLEGRVRMAEV